MLSQSDKNEDSDPYDNIDPILILKCKDCCFQWFSLSPLKWVLMKYQDSIIFTRNFNKPILKFENVYVDIVIILAL